MNYLAKVMSWIMICSSLMVNGKYHKVKIKIEVERREIHRITLKMRCKYR